MNYLPFTVTVKDETKTNKIWDYYKTSKPQMEEKDLPSVAGILKMGLPINGLKYYVLEFQSSLMFRDLILSQRDILGAWAVSNRVAKINKDTTCLSLEAKKFLGGALLEDVEESLEEVYRRIEKGEPQEYVKGDLPIMTSTKFTVGIDLRTLVNFLYTLEIHCPEYFDYIGNIIINSLKLSDIYKEHPKRDKFKELSISDKDKVSGSIGSMYSIYKKDVSMNLLAQVVRKNIIVKSGMWNSLSSNHKLFMMKRTKDPVEMTIYLTEDNIHSLQSTRCCWFAQMDKSNNQSWDYILREMIDKLNPSQFLNILPCHGCGDYCVIKDDMMARVDKIDSHFYPCPLLIEDPSVIDERIKKYGSDSVIMKKWKESQSIISFNPGNEYFLRYRK